MKVGQNISEPLEVTVPSIDLFMKLWQFNLESDVISSQEITLIFSETDDIDLDRGESEFIDFLDALFGFHVEIHIVVINREALEFGLCHHGFTLGIVLFGFGF